MSKENFPNKKKENIDNKLKKDKENNLENDKSYNNMKKFLEDSKTYKEKKNKEINFDTYETKSDEMKNKLKGKKGNNNRNNSDSLDIDTEVNFFQVNLESETKAGKNGNHYSGAQNTQNSQQNTQKNSDGKNSGKNSDGKNITVQKNNSGNTDNDKDKNKNYNGNIINNNAINTTKNNNTKSNKNLNLDKISEIEENLKHLTIEQKDQNKNIKNTQNNPNPSNLKENQKKSKENNKNKEENLINNNLSDKEDNSLIEVKSKRKLTNSQNAKLLNEDLKEKEVLKQKRKSNLKLPTNKNYKNSGHKLYMKDEENLNTLENERLIKYDDAEKMLMTAKISNKSKNKLSYNNENDVNIKWLEPYDKISLKNSEKIRVELYGSERKKSITNQKILSPNLNFEEEQSHLIKNIIEEDETNLKNQFGSNISKADLNADIRSKKLKLMSFNSINQKALLNTSEESLFFKDPYFQKELQEKKRINLFNEETNKDKIMLNKKLIYSYLNPRKNRALPKFMKISEKEKHCIQIMSLTDATLEDKIYNFYDTYPCLSCRKFCYKYTSYINKYALKFVENKFFDNFFLCVILLNTVFLLISNPTDPNSIANISDDYFLYLYTVEMISKILAYGFILPKDSYIKDTWNILDFIVVVVSWISFLIKKTSGGDSIKGLAGLRTFRILRPLKTVKSIKGLRRIISTLLESMLALGDILIVLIFFFLIFAVAAVQMWSGNFLQRCQSSVYGYPLDLSTYSTLCTSNSDCEKFNSAGERFFCSKTLQNPDQGYSSYDDTLNAMIGVFMISTMEGWTEYYNYTCHTFRDSIGINKAIIILYYHILLIISGYYLINLFLAVILNKFSEVENKNRSRKEEKVSLYHKLINTFDHEGEGEENENELEVKQDIDEEDLETQDQIREKIKKKINVFEYENDEKTASYDGLKKIFFLKKYSPKELYNMKIEVHKEANKALEELEEIMYNQKLKKKEKLHLQKKNSKNDLISRKPTKRDEYEKLRKNTQFSYGRSAYSIDAKNLLIDKKSVKTAMNMTLEKMLQERKDIKLKAENMKKERLEREKKSKKKNYMDQIITKLKNNNKYEVSPDNSLSEEEILDKGKSTTDIENTRKDSKINYDKQRMSIPPKNNKENNMSYSIDTSDDEDSQEENNMNNIINNKNFIDKYMKAKSGKITDEKNQNNNNIDDIKNLSDIDSPNITIPIQGLKENNITLEENSLINNQLETNENKKDILVKKKNLIDQQNDMYNTVVVNKPENPMYKVNKLKEEKILQKKKELNRDKFKVEDLIKSQKPNLRGKLNRHTSYLKFLNRCTEETQGKVKKETVQELKDYNEELEEINSLEISRNDDEFVVVDTDSRINESDIDIKKSNDSKERENKELEFIDLENYKNPKATNQFEIHARKSEFNNFKNKRNTVSVFKGGNIMDVINLARQKSSTIIDYKDSNNDENLNNNILYNYKIKDDDEINFNDDNNKNEYNAFEGFKEYQKSPSIIRNLQILGKSDKRNKKKIRIRSYSIRKNGFKYTKIDEIFNDREKEKEKQKDKDKDNKKPFTFYDNYDMEIINDELTGYRKYQRMLNFYMDKDFKVKSNFNCDEYIEDVMGISDKNILMKNSDNDNIDPIKIFNNSDVHIKKSSYLKYTKIDDEIFRFTEIANNLKHLRPSIFKKLNPYSLNFRALNDPNSSKANKGIKKIIVEGNEYNKTEIVPLKQNEFTEFRENFKSQSSLHISKQINTNPLNKITLLVINKIKEQEMNSNFQKFLDLEFSKKLSEFFEFDRPFTSYDKKKPQIKIDFSTENFSEVKNEIRKIRNFDNEMSIRKYKNWSAQQVMLWNEDEKYFDEWNRLINLVENTNIILWSKNCFVRFFTILKYFLFKISISQIFDFFIISVVLLNILLMIVDGNLMDPKTLQILQLSNYAFNGVFILEFIVKFIGLGPVIYFSDAFTYLDLAIIGFGILDMVSSPPPTLDIEELIQNNSSEAGQSNIASQLSFLRVFRIFRVTRIAKVLKKIKSFRKVITGITRSISNVSYNLLIVLIFLLIFQLLGMNLLNADPNFQGFLISFYSTFQILTMENWNSIYYSLSNTYSRITIFFIIIWIFLGNYVLFNLFISILLNSFDLEDPEEELPEGMPKEFEKLEEMEREMKKSKKAKKKKKENKSKENKDERDLDDTDSENEEEEHKHINQKINNNYRGGKRFIKERDLINKVFKDNECEYSLYIFGQTNKFRLWCVDLITLKSFDNFILLMILLSTLRLVIGTFISGELSSVIFDFIDVIFILVFLFEMIMKIVSLGFVIGNGTYLTDNWNRIDFIICVVSIIDLQAILGKYTSGSESGASLNFLRVLRILRTLRPLRFISHNVQLKIIINSLFDSIIPIGNVLIIVLVIIIVFSIIGMNLFSDVYDTCYIEDPSGNTAFASIANFNDKLYGSIEEKLNECNKYGGIIFATPTFKFDNILNAMLTSYVLANGEGWCDVMNSYNQFNIFYGIFFILYWLTVTTFFMNLFVGILFSCFNEAWQKENNSEIKDDPEIEQYYDFLMQVDLVLPNFATFKKPEEGIQKTLFIITEHSIFENFIMFIIICNLITMAISFEGMSDNYINILDIINLIFTAIFICEAIMKLIANGLKRYFYFAWNKFDFFVVSASILDLGVTYGLSGNNTAFLKSFQIFRVLRVLRVTRVLRLVRSLRGLEKLIQTLRWSLDALMNVMILLMLIFCIFSIIGCFLFDVVSFDKNPERFANYNEYFNFKDFMNSIILCFRTATGENWPLMMVEVAFYDPEQVSPEIVFLYFTVMNFITYTIMLNLFLLVTLQQYEDFHRKKTNPIEKFNEIIDGFKKAWNPVSSESDQGWRIKNISMNDFLISLEGDLNKSKSKRLDIIKKYIMDLTLLNDDKNYVYFHDVLYKMIRYEYGKDLGKKSKFIKKAEDKLVMSINKKIENFIKLNEPERLRNFSLNTFNPLTCHLYFKVSHKFMKSFLTFYLESVKEKKKNLIYFPIDQNKNDEDILTIQKKRNIYGVSSSKKFVEGMYYEGKFSAVNGFEDLPPIPNKEINAFDSSKSSARADNYFKNCENNDDENDDDKKEKVKKKGEYEILGKDDNEIN